jgi:myo-inositol-1(or 4)-monophosphatase
MEMKHIALKAVQKAGSLLMENINDIKEISLKQKNDYLTNIDIEAEKLIKAIVKSAFPQHSFVAEESAIEKNSPEYTWYIDPISSTMNYVHGLPHFAVTIALQEKKQFIFSAVLDPFFQELFYAEKGQGAYLNDRRIHVSSTDTLSKALLFMGIQTKGDGNKEEGIRHFERLLPQIATYRRFGSLALELCYVAAGRIDGQVHTGTDIFSIPAGKLIVEEAGGRVTDFASEDWDLMSKSVLATNGKVHSELVKVLQNI